MSQVEDTITFWPTQQTRMGRMLAAGRLTATMRSKKTQQHITLTVECMKKGERWEHVPFAEATHVFIKMGQGGYGSGQIGTYYPNSKKLYWKSRDTAWQFAARHTLLAAGSGQQDTSLYIIEEEERCGKCGRALTDPESIARGIGPTCLGQQTGSVHYSQDEANLVDDLQDRLPPNPARDILLGRRELVVPTTYEELQEATDKKGRNVPRTFEALATACKQQRGAR